MVVEGRDCGTVQQSLEGGEGGPGGPRGGGVGATNGLRASDEDGDLLLNLFRLGHAACIFPFATSRSSHL